MDIYYATRDKESEKINWVAKAPDGKTVEDVKKLIEEGNIKEGFERFVLLEGLSSEVAQIKISEYESYQENAKRIISYLENVDYEISSYRSHLDEIVKKEQKQ